MLGLSTISVAALFIVMAIPLIQGKVKMNRTYGIRIKKAFESKDNWYKINAYGGRCFLAWSIVLALVGVAAFFLPVETNRPVFLIVIFAPLIVIVPCVAQILIYARKL